jgi:hypothetical protein
LEKKPLKCVQSILNSDILQDGGPLHGWWWWWWIFFLKTTMQSRRGRKEGRKEARGKQQKEGGSERTAHQSCPRTKRAQNIVPCASQYKGQTNQVLR